MNKKYNHTHANVLRQKTEIFKFITQVNVLSKINGALLPLSTLLSSMLC